MITNNGDWTITGIKQSGKGRICKEIIMPMFLRTKRQIAVCDPLGDQWPGAAWVTKDPIAYVNRMKRSQGLIGIVDEVSLIRRAKNKAGIEELERFAPVSRHYGHIMFWLAQRIMMIPPAIRDVCENAVVFRQPRPSLQILADQLDEPAVLEASKFPRGIGLVIQPFETPVKIKVF